MRNSFQRPELWGEFQTLPDFTVELRGSVSWTIEPSVSVALHLKWISNDMRLPGSPVNATNGQEQGVS
ncbi:protein of unknown function [Candidatus Filomicrobium marinum]|nr:protein of unknown function [Candidatus Filomicrobium marinum]